MNYLDIAVIIIVLACVISGRMKGFVLTSLSFLPIVSGLFITNRAYPIASKYIRKTIFFEKFKDGVAKTLGIMDFKESMNQGVSDIQVIENLKLPNIFKQGLIENNNPIVKNIFDAGSIGDYIVSYIANACINVLCMIVIYFIVVFIIKAIIRALDIVSKLPVLNFLNKTLGGVLGLVKGLFVVWMSGLVLVFFYTNPMFSKAFDVLYQSKVALFLYENNVLLFMILRILA